MNLGLVLAGGRDEMAGSAGGDGSGRGGRDAQGISAGSRPVPETSADTIGLTLAEGRSTLAGLQKHLVRFQAEVFCREQRLCGGCSAHRPIRISVPAG